MAKITEAIKVNGELPHTAWPGGYPLFYIDGHSEAICPKCANSAIKELDKDDKSFPQAYEVNWEDDLYCGDCGVRIPAAYRE